MTISEIKTGLKGEAKTEVTAAHTAAALGSGTVEVYATPAMIALMEEAAVAALADALPAELTSVGIYLEIHHLAATPPGMAVQATATVIEVDGRMVTFEVNASDSTEAIGRGTHRRAIVESAKFQQRTQQKLSNT